MVCLVVDFFGINLFEVGFLNLWVYSFFIVFFFFLREGVVTFESFQSLFHQVLSPLLPEH